MGEHDRNIMFLSGRNHLVVPDRAAGFHDCCDPGRGKDIEAVPEWEEPVAGGDGPGRTVPCLHKRPFRCAHSALIPTAAPFLTTTIAFDLVWAATTHATSRS